MQLRLMSSNIWGEYFGNEVDYRDRQLEGIYRKYQPDVLGLQEMMHSWWASPMWKDLEDQFRFVPVATDGKLNYTPLLYRSDRLEVVDSGWHLYHEELDPSKGFTWVVFQDKQSEQQFAVFNTHFWWKDKLVEHDVIRRYNAMELVHWMRQIGQAYDCPTFFMGDLNCGVESLAWKYLNSCGWETSFAMTENCSGCSSHHGDPVRGADGRYHGQVTGKAKECSIDHIGATRGTRILKQVVITDQDALDATDHSPVYVDVEL